VWSLLNVGGAGDTTNADLVAFAWRKGDDLAVIAGNITGHDAKGLIEIGELPAGDVFELKDQLSDESYTWTRAGLEHGCVALHSATRICF
jgi:hypothetical protein